MKRKVNLAIQVLPQSDVKHPYAIVDRAIAVIQESGVVYKVCPFETVMEGDFDRLMEIVKKVYETCHQEGAKSMMTYIKIQSKQDEDVLIEDKMAKYN
jgi:uncharacterized protein (TIGR00106 family)